MRKEAEEWNRLFIAGFGVADEDGRADENELLAQEGKRLFARGDVHLKPHGLPR
jgi:hypothetical protein